MSPELAGATRAALIVAAYEFEDTRFQRLRSPARDVDALVEVLADPAIGRFSVQTVVNESDSVVETELERFFSDRKPEDLLLLYFSCHGVKDSTGKLYFATTNTAFDVLRATGIPASFVSEQMELTRSKRVVVLLDCCYSGAFLKGFQARGDDSVPVDELEGRGRAVITASRATEYAFEDKELTAAHARPSVFTGAVIEGLSTGAADRDGDGVISVDELYDFVYEHVRGKVAGQTPGRWLNLEGGLAIARNPHPPARPAPLPAELGKAVESEVALHRLGAVRALQHWLDDGGADQKLAARTVLERLTHDYDERVRSAAAEVLAARPPEPPESPPGPPRPRPSSWVTGRRGALVAGGIVAIILLAALISAILASTRNGDEDPTTAGSPVDVVVDGTQPWTDTEVDLRAGDQVHVTATGVVFHNEFASTGPDGYSGDPTLLTPVGTANHAGLIGRITQSGAPFLLGANAEFTADQDGRLYLGINDGGLENNSGEFDASVTVTQP